MRQPESVLIVDDQSMTLATLQAALELDGYQLFTASDGLEALEVLKTNHIDIIIADIAMPRMNGYELYKVVRQDSRWAHIPFIFLTERSMDSDIRYGKEMGVDDYLTKPFQLEDLRASISGKLRRSRKQIHLLPASHHETTQSGNVIIAGELQIHPDQHRLIVRGVDVSLSAKEFALLSHLARHRGVVISLEDLCEVTHNFKTNKVEAGSLLYPLIRSLRRKIKNHNINPGCIQNVRGVGYYMV
jgi:DNA-binding response OmpR family regulator